MDFVLTADLDWASEHCIEDLLGLAAGYGVRPTLFVTHASALVAQAARRGAAELGIHPNFLPGSTHGSTIDEVIGHVLGLVPTPVAVRCHAYADSTHIARALVARGLRLDSNLCLHLQSDLRPLHHWAGLVRLPVFYEDDVHAALALDWRFEAHRERFFSRGLKILDVHPFHTALNVPDESFYRRHKSHIPTLDAAGARAMAHRGPGARSFLVEAIEAVLDGGHRFVTLGELAASLGCSQ